MALQLAANPSAARPVILILGPTAGGKTALSLALAQRLPGGGEIVSADSMQVYEGMDIGTAKATPEERAQVPHHLIDLVEPDESFTVNDWLTAAQSAIADIRRRGRWPVVVGGTNLYVKAFLDGLFQGPPANEGLRAALAALPTEELHRRLAAVDAAAAQRIHPNDRKRLTRALEVFEATGRPISEWQRQWDDVSERPGGNGLGDDLAEPGAGCADVAVVGLDWPVEAINPRINARVKAMVAAGLVEEARRLWASGGLGRQAREALGYKQLIEHFEGRATLEEAVEQIKVETRRFARKQRTWLKRLRHRRPAIWIDAATNEAQTIIEQALTFCVGL